MARFAGYLPALVAAVALVPAVEAVELSPGDILVVLSSARQIVRVDPATGVQTLVASDGEMVTPLDVAVTADRHLLVVDADAFGGMGGGLIRIDPSDGSQTAAALAGGFVDPGALSLEADGSAVVVDPSSGGGRVFRVPVGSAIPVEIAQVGDAGSLIGEPENALVEADGTILIADGLVPSITHFGVVAIDPVTLDQTVISAATLFLSDPTARMDVAVDTQGDVFVAWTGEDEGSTTGLILRLDPVSGVPQLFPPFASDTLFNALTAEASGDFLTTIPLSGLVRIDPEGTQSAVSSFVNAFGVAVVFAACNDTFDNDDVGFADFPADPGCTSADDDDESGGVIAPVPALAGALRLLLCAVLVCAAALTVRKRSAPGPR